MARERVRSLKVRHPWCHQLKRVEGEGWGGRSRIPGCIVGCIVGDAGWCMGDWWAAEGVVETAVGQHLGWETR